MGAETQNQRLAGSAVTRMRSAQAAREGIAQRQKAIEMAENAPQTGEASMFPEEAPRLNVPFQSDVGESAEVTPGGAVERGATLFGAPFGGAGQGQIQGLRSGIVFGPSRSTRIPEVGSPEYQQLLQRVRDLQNR
jgi:hypothetical protein